jgi:hypothetical protein
MDEVAYHRTFTNHLIWAGVDWAGHEYGSRFSKAVSHTKGVQIAWAFREKHFVQILIVERQDQDFWRFATSWEWQWSKLVFASNRFHPFVNENMQVIGHFGWMTADWIFAPSIRMSLSDKLKAGLDVFVTKQAPRATYQPVGVLDESYLLYIDIHGRVLLENGYKNRDGVEAEWVTPYDLWVGAKLVVSLTGYLRGKIVATAVSRFTRSVPGGLFRELTEAELQAVRGAGPGRSLVVGRGAIGTRSTVPDVGIPETMGPSAWNPDYPTLLQNALQKYPHLQGQFEDAFIERIGINLNPVSEATTMGLTPGGVKAARDLLRPGGTLRILEKPTGGATFDLLESDIRSLISKDFTITKVERHPDGLLVTATKK